MLNFVEINIGILDKQSNAFRKQKKNATFSLSPFILAIFTSKLGILAMETEVEKLRQQIEAQNATIALLKNRVRDIKWLDAAAVKQRFSISDTTLYRYRIHKKIPFTKLGGRYLYPESFFTKSLMAKMENSELL